VGERDREAVTVAGGPDPYREGATVAAPDRRTHYAPMTRREERMRRWLRSVPVLLLAMAAFAVERPWLLGVAMAWGLGVIVLSRLSARSLNARLKALAGTLARDGDPFVAARALEAIVADARGYAGFHSVALLFLGIARARGGDADGALELLYVVQRGGWLAHRAVWLAWLLPWMSQLHAARGEVELAEQWLDAARAKLPGDRQDALMSAEALLGLRRNRDAEVIAAIDAYVGQADATDPVREHYALLRAFACERAGRPMPEDEVRRLVASRLSAPGRALPLEKWWVDFAAFLERHAPQADTA
jgi:hypothetical protein